MSVYLSDCYEKSALNIEDGIPVFSVNDFYIENYDRISSDHLKCFETTGQNPFMDEKHWVELENSTERLIHKYAIEQDIKILDVGVGLGRLLERFPYMSRFGVDISRGYLRHAKAKGIEVCLSRIEDMPYKKKYFDIVLATDVLEHVIDLNIAVREILGIVKEGGFIVVRVPYKEDLAYYLTPTCPYDFVHLRNFDENSLRVLFEKIFNVQVIELTYTGYECGRPKIGANIRYYAAIIRRVLNVVKMINGKMYNYMVQRLIQPNEINIVIQNSKKDTKRSR
jgi:SAM-dependent methyltransferase